MPEIEPASKLGQMDLDLGVKVDGMETFHRFRAGNHNWASCYKAYVKALPPGKEGMAEDWRKEVRRWIGDPSNPNTVGPACGELKAEGYLEYARHAAPRDAKSHGSQKIVWRRTSRQ